MANKKAKFRLDWMDPNLNPSFSEWLEEDMKNSNNAKCKVCKTVFSLSNMGVQALKSHQNSVKHRQTLTNRTKSVDIRSFDSKKDMTVGDKSTDTIRQVQPTTTNQVSSEEHHDQNAASSGFNTLPTSSTSAITSRVNFNTFLKTDHVKKGEIMWCIFTVLMHLSLRTAANAVKLFPKIFSDSNIANKFQLQKDKIAYMISYGLAPFFKNQLLSSIRKLPFFNISFDESLNKVAQMNQMDVIIRYWCPVENKVSTRYLTSVFLGHSKSSDLLDAFEKELPTEINVQNIFQISMDGPSVNWKFLKELEETIQTTSESKKFINLGSCGLHVIHNAFKTGINSTGWNTVSFLRGIYNIFKNVPARRADFIKFSEFTVFPKKFCAVRWLSNASVAERAITMVLYLSKYIQKAKGEKCLPNTFSMNNVEKAIENPMLPAQLAFFQSLASELEPFLTKYQSDEPLAPFLHGSIYNLLKSLMSRFVKEEILDAATSSLKLAKIDIDKSENLKTVKEINLGYETRMVIRSIKSANVISDGQIIQFRQECKKCLIQCTKKILEKSPLKYKMTKGASCLMPENILNPKSGLGCIKQALEVLTDNKWFSDVAADSIERSYISFCSNQLVINVCKEFDSKTERLDELFAPILNQEKNESFVMFVKMILTVFHGNAAVERGFSVNSDCLIENLKNESLIAQRIVYDATSSLGGVENIEIIKEMLNYVSQSNERWKDALKKKKIQEEESAEKNRKRKIVLKQIEELKAKKKKTLEESSLHLSAFDEEIEELEKSLKN